MVQERGQDKPTATSDCILPATTNSPAPSQANKAWDVFTAVWEIAPALHARQVKVEITTRDVNKTAKLLLPTQCPRLKVTLETDFFNKYLKISVDQPRAKQEKQKFRIVNFCPSQTQTKRLIVLRLIKIGE